MLPNRFPSLALAGLMLSTAMPTAFATGSVTGYATGGLAITPEYAGSSDTQLVPLAAGEVRQGNRYVLLEGLSLRANVIDSATWEAGPIATYTFGRDASVESAAVARLPALDDAVDLGAFVARQWPGVLRDRDVVRVSLQATTDVTDVHDGWQVVPTMSYGTAIGERWTLRIDASATYASRSFQRTYFGVSVPDAATSGLRAYTPDAGVMDAGIAMLWSYAVTDRWSIDGFVGARRLLGDAADSPIVTDAGDPTQVTVALGVGRRF